MQWDLFTQEDLIIMCQIDFKIRKDVTLCQLTQKAIHVKYNKFVKRQYQITVASNIYPFTCVRNLTICSIVFICVTFFCFQLINCYSYSISSLILSRIAYDMKKDMIDSANRKRGVIRGNRGGRGGYGGKGRRERKRAECKRRDGRQIR